MATSETWVDRILHAALRTQYRISPLVPADVRLAGANRKARLVITGDSGNTYFLRWNGYELVEEFDAKGVRNNIEMHEQTLADLASGELSLRDAVAARLITIDGEKSLYDSEEIEQLFEKLISSLRGAVKTRW